MAAPWLSRRAASISGRWRRNRAAGALAARGKSATRRSALPEPGASASRTPPGLRRRRRLMPALRRIFARPPFGAPSLLLAGQDRAEDLPRGLLDDRALARIAFDQRLHELLRLFEGDMRRERRHFRVGLDLEHDRAARRQRFVPGRAELVGIVAIDTAKADQFGEAMVRNVRDFLAGVEFGIAVHHPLLPGDLVQVLIVEDAADPLSVGPFPPVFGDGDQF